ncbi:Uncharacterised protein [Actinobacillus porcinus]|uniref:Uncharacterized protein n=1 Tax=Actinobacillus porcinus TaxID=51048 RepID=A0ABY6TKQ8_9PAST|nr:Uncharacterised protein [Actinobacillus porcinus]VTU08754.1 Uncharacterised protein [Actinobacillus porcinus]
MKTKLLFIIRILLTLSQILCKHPFQLNGDRLGDHQNQS